jgi:hypothetical protein
MVDFPEPDGPTMATHSPGRSLNDMLVKMGVSGREGYAKEMESKVTLPEIGKRREPSASRVVVGKARRRSKSRAASFVLAIDGTDVVSKRYGMSICTH